MRTCVIASCVYCLFVHDFYALVHGIQHTYTYIHLHVRLYTCKYIHIPTYTCSHVQAYADICIHAHTCACSWVHMHTYMHAYMHTCMHTYKVRAVALSFLCPSGNATEHEQVASAPQLTLILGSSWRHADTQYLVPWCLFFALLTRNPRQRGHRRNWRQRQVSKLMGSTVIRRLPWKVEKDV